MAADVAAFPLPEPENSALGVALYRGYSIQGKLKTMWLPVRKQVSGENNFSKSHIVLKSFFEI